VSEQRTFAVDAPDATAAVEKAKRIARNQGLRVRTVASCRPAFGNVDPETGLPNRWDVTLAVEEAA
jgi:hypothetical protein